MDKGFDLAVDRIARESGFSGAIRIDADGTVRFARAYGLADRAHQLPNTLGTRFATASAVKGLTALAVLGLIGEGRMSLQQTARSVLGKDLPLIDDAVTVEQLLSHRSGIGDYLDENADLEVTDYVLPVSVHRLVHTEDYLQVLDGFPQSSPPGERFAYCNGGYVVLALMAERCAGEPFHDVLQRLVCGPAGMSSTAFLRSDELPGDAAVGYLDEVRPRTNVFHLPVLGSGDGGIYTTVADVHSFWSALLDGRILPQGQVAEAIRAHSDAPELNKRYGLGFWLAPAGPVVMLEGCDAGVSFRSLSDPDTGMTATVVSNSTDGAWPVARHLAAAFGV